MLKTLTPNQLLCIAIQHTGEYGEIEHFESRPGLMCLRFAGGTWLRIRSNGNADDDMLIYEYGAATEPGAESFWVRDVEAGKTVTHHLCHKFK